MQPDLPIIQRTYDLIQWFVPLLNKFPRDQKFMLGDRVQVTLYGFLESLLRARYRRDKLELLESLNAEMDVLRYQPRLCMHFTLLSERRYAYVRKLINEIGENLGGWIRLGKRYKYVLRADIEKYFSTIDNGICEVRELMESLNMTNLQRLLLIREPFSLGRERT